MRRRDRVQRLLADALRPIQPDEPVRRGAEDQRRPRPPGVRVGVHQLATSQQAAGFIQRGGDLVVRLVDMQAGEQRHPRIEGAVVAHRVGHLQSVLAAELEVVGAGVGGDVHEAGAGLEGHEIAQQHRHVEIVAAAAQGMGADRAGEVRTLQHMHEVVRGDTDILDELRQQFHRHDQLLADARAGIRLHRIDVEHRVVERPARGDRAVAWHGPGRGGPDHQRRTVQFRLRCRYDREAHPDRVRGMVVVLDLGLGQRGLLHRRPQHRAQAPIQRAIQQELADLGSDRRLGRVVHGGVALTPVALHAEAAEFRHLHRQPMLGIGAALGAEIQHRDRVLVLLRLAVLLLDLPLDRQAVAVPAGDVVGVVAGHLAGAVDHVLVDLVQRGADVDVAVRIGRAVVEDEFRPPARGLPDLRPEVHLVPARQDLRLPLRQVAAHREGGPRQEDGVAVVALGRIGRCVVHGVSRRQMPLWGGRGARVVPGLSKPPGR